MKKSTLQKVINLRTDEIYYTYSDWEPKYIDGKKFIAVVRNYIKCNPKFFMNIESLRITAVSTVESTRIS